MKSRRVDRPPVDLAARALDVMPGGASHDGRQLEPIGLFVESADGARKIDSDGHSYIDFACGNGALMLGHGHKASVQAALKAIRNGFHFSAGSEAELRWAELIRSLMPAAQQVRFTSSGNEACLLALAVAHATTLKGSILTIAGHYHGWAVPALLPKLSLTDFLSTAPENADLVIVEARDIREAVEAIRSERFGAVILEPTGPSFGKVPLDPESVRRLAESAKLTRSLCIFDETITGFRVAPGGAQQLLGVTPDLIVLGKILGGGLPCGALAGRRDLLGVLDNRPGRPEDAACVYHMGTGNGNPVVASVGFATLSALADGAAIASADAAGERLRGGLNSVFAAQGIPWAAYGLSSGFHIFLNPSDRAIDPTHFDPGQIPEAELAARNQQLINDLRVALLADSVDINPWPGGLVSSAHYSPVIDEALLSFERALKNLAARYGRLSGWGGTR